MTDIYGGNGLGMPETPRPSGLGWPGDMSPAQGGRSDTSLERLMAGALTHENEDPAIAAVRLVAAERDQEHRRAEHWKQLALTDELTGLPNRRAIMQTVDTLVQREAGAFALMYIDLDDLKRENKRGHEAGDQLIIGTANAIIGRSLRTRDEGQHETRPHDIEGSDAARVGGDEFIVVLRGVREQAELTAVNNRIITNLEEADINASTGAALHEPGMTATDLVYLADRAMDLDKSERRAARQVQKRAALPPERQAGHAALRALAAKRGIDLQEHWDLYGPTSR
jgi:diguanylate cyclase (GGDEF)-like protein